MAKGIPREFAGNVSRLLLVTSASTSVVQALPEYHNKYININYLQLSNKKKINKKKSPTKQLINRTLHKNNLHEYKYIDVPFLFCFLF